MPFLTRFFFWASPTKIDYRKKKQGTFIPTSLLEDLGSVVAVSVEEARWTCARSKEQARSMMKCGFTWHPSLSILLPGPSNSNKYGLPPNLWGECPIVMGSFRVKVHSCPYVTRRASLHASGSRIDSTSMS